MENRLPVGQLSISCFRSFGVALPVAVCLRSVSTKSSVQSLGIYLSPRSFFSRLFSERTDSSSRLVVAADGRAVASQIMARNGAAGQVIDLTNVSSLSITLWLAVLLSDLFVLLNVSNHFSIQVCRHSLWVYRFSWALTTIIFHWHSSFTISHWLCQAAMVKVTRKCIRGQDESELSPLSGFKL